MRNFTLLIKPAGPDCNIACKYCFYSGKKELFGDNSHRMSLELAQKLIKDYMEVKLPVSCFAWQGGEPTLMGLDFYKQVVELQRKYGSQGQLVTNALQTNGVLLDDEWCAFLREYNWLVGISLDGPREYHDHYRRDFAGNGTYDRVMEAIKCCKKHKVEFNVLVLLNDRNVKAPDELFDFFVEKNIKFLQFVPCVEKDPLTGEISDFSITPEEYGKFLCRTFDRWQKHGITKLSVRLFDSILHYYLYGRHANCTFNRKCDDYIVIEHNGDAFCCDFFVGDDYRLGNIQDSTLPDLVFGETKKRFADSKSDLCSKCFVCRFKDICRGGCMKDRLAINDDVKSASYFCESYKMFFDHALPKLRNIASDVAAGKVPK